MSTFYHGFLKGETLTPHIGLCLTDDLSAAESYAQGGKVAVVRFGVCVFSGPCGHPHALTKAAVEVSREGREAVTYPGDDGALGAADLLTYEDSDMQGRDHDTVRLNSDKAVRWCRVVCIVDAEWAPVMVSSGIDERAWPGFIKAWQALDIDEPGEVAGYLELYGYDMGMAFAAAIADLADDEGE